jgi:hypothetical protein
MKPLTQAVMQDKRNGIMLMRFVASNAGLQRRSGILGLSSSGGSALDVVEVTETLLNQIASPGRGRPRNCAEERVHVRGGRGAPGDPKLGKLDRPFLDYLRQRIHFFTADGEAAEQLAGELCRNKNIRLSTGLQPVLPQLRIVNHDLAHGSRRITSRPWKADAFLNEVFKEIVTKKGSIVSVIQESHVFTEWFVKNKILFSSRDAQEPDTVKNLSLARHRFDTTSKPLSRAVRHFKALVRTAEQILQIRRPESKEGKRATEFLGYVDEEKALQLAMLADAGVECMGLTRFVDNEFFATEDLPWQVETLLQRITLLFVDGHCMRSGHTGDMAKTLKTPQQFFLQGDLKVLGGPGALKSEVVKRCLSRMACWVKMAAEVLESEFPKFRVLTALSVFSLPDFDALESSAAPELKTTSIQRLAQFFNLDGTKLELQLDDMYLLARSVKLANPKLKLSNQDAWRMAMTKVRGVETTELSKPLQAWMAWSPSTSGIEQSFSQVQRVFGDRLQSMTDMGLLDLVNCVVERKYIEANGTVFESA